MEAKYLVTGGAGFVGSNLVTALTARGDRVRVLDNLSTGHWENLDGIGGTSLVERVTGDIRDPETIATCMRGVEIVFHQAALGSVPKSVRQPVDSDSSNVNGTVSVLDAARHAGVRRVIFAASSSAYGETEELPKHEGITPQPLSPYAVSKLAGEQYMKVFASVYGIETLCLRYFNVFGPGQNPDGAYAAAIPRFVDAAMSDRPIQIFGDGQQTRDFCFVKNTVTANLLAADSPRKFAGEIVNIAGARRVELNRLVEVLSETLGRPIAVEHVAPRPGDIRHSLGAIDRAKDLLGYEPKVLWEDGIAITGRYLAALRSDGLSAASHVIAELWG